MFFQLNYRIIEKFLLAHADIIPPSARKTFRNVTKSRWVIYSDSKGTKKKKNTSTIREKWHILQGHRRHVNARTQVC